MPRADAIVLDTHIWLDVAIGRGRFLADRLIVATARHLNALLVTRDGAILDYAEASKAVRTLEPS